MGASLPSIRLSARLAPPAATESLGETAVIDLRGVWTMSNLVAIAYPNRETAEQVRRTLIEMQKEHLIEMEDMVVVTRDEGGKVKLHQSMSVAGAGAAGGALWGGLIGLLFLAPLVGMAVGAAARGAAGPPADLRAARRGRGRGGRHDGLRRRRQVHEGPRHEPPGRRRGGHRAGAQEHSRQGAAAH